MTEWDTTEDLAPVLGRDCGTVWLRELKLVELPESGGIQAVIQRTPALEHAITALKKRPRKCRWGPLLHNDTENGFDAAFGQRILSNGKSIASQICTLAKQEDWRAFQVDLESLEASQAAPYESFLTDLHMCLKKRDVRLSVAVHAVNPDMSSKGHVGEFQRFGMLAKNADLPRLRGHGDLRC
jgi:spore germination protein YaaH